MKLVSPKTLLASLLGCTFVVMKVMTFDGPFGFGLFRNNATQSHPDGTSADCSGICYLVQLVCFKA